MGTGEFAALGTALAFAFTSTFFTLSGREIGSSLVNRLRLLLAVLLIFGLHWLTFGQPLPIGATSGAVFWLSLSGIIGLALGDASLFQAFVTIGPRLSMLMMSLSPIVSAVLAWIFLDETLSTQEVAGILLTIGGIAWVISERSAPTTPSTVKAVDQKTHFIGLLFAFGGAAGQAVGFVTAKMGLGDDFAPLSALMIRLVAAAIFVWIFTLYQRQGWSSFATLRAHPRAIKFLTMGTLIGPVIGVWLSLIAVQQAAVGIASTLIALTPIFLLPIGYLVFHEKVTLRAVLGTIVAFIGTALLFL